MKKEHFLNPFYTDLTLNEKINVKAYWIQKGYLNEDILTFEFICITE